jgi:hypothetical protein
MRIERDFPGHFICADRCRFFRTTDVNGYRISTVGDMRYENKMVEVGWGRRYETMVFRLGKRICNCGCKAPTVLKWAELDCAGYNSRKAAIAGHEKMVAKWEAVESTTTRKDGTG